VFESFADVPLDAPPLSEGDDSVPARGKERRVVAKLTASGVSVSAIQRTLVVPWRPLFEGDSGDFVYALKRAIARRRGKGRLLLLMTRPLEQRMTWGEPFTRELRSVQRSLALKDTGTYDRKTHIALAPYYDAFALALITAPSVDPRIAKQLAWHTELYNRRWDARYSQYRPSQLRKASSITRADCSGSIAGGCDWAGILPKTDWRWTNTDSQILMGERVATLAAALPGDVVLYGRGTDPNHEALYLGEERVWSFGSYPIKILPVDYNRGRLGSRIAIRRFVAR
jgi:hypothetical protein